MFINMNISAPCQELRTSNAVLYLEKDYIDLIPRRSRIYIKDVSAVPILSFTSYVWKTRNCSRSIGKVLIIQAFYFFIYFSGICRLQSLLSKERFAVFYT